MTLKNNVKNRTFTLLKALLLSANEANILKNTKDEALRKAAKNSLGGKIALYVVLLVYSTIIAIGYGAAGLAKDLPVMAMIAVSAVSLLFTIFKTNGYLFAFREYDMLMAMPFEVSEIVAAKFLYMYIVGSPILLIILASMLIGYAVYVSTGIVAILLWIAMGLFATMIPMTLGSLIGALVARVGAGFKHKKVVQAILIFVVCIPAVFSGSIIQSVVKDDKINDVLASVGSGMDKAAGIYVPAKWFGEAIANENPLYALLFIGVSIAIFGLFTIIVGGSYRKINSMLMVGEAKGKFTMTEQKSRSAVNAVAFKEFKRFTGSTVYLTNAGMGQIIVTVFAIISLFVKPEKIIEVMLKGAPIDASILVPAIPLVIYMFLGMVATTCCTPSLEGKNNWIMQSMPISKMDNYKGKMLFNLYLTIPFTVFATICLCICFRVGFLSTLLYLVCGIILDLFSTTFGMVCGLKHVKLNWQNDIEVVKQGTALVVYLFPNLFITMGLVVGIVFLGKAIGADLAVLLLMAVVAALAAVCYAWVRKRALR